MRVTRQFFTFQRPATSWFCFVAARLSTAVSAWVESVEGTCTDSTLALKCLGLGRNLSCFVDTRSLSCGITYSLKVPCEGAVYLVLREMIWPLQSPPTLLPVKMIVGILKFATSFDHSDCMMHHLHGSEDGCQNRQCLGPRDDGSI